MFKVALPNLLGGLWAVFMGLGCAHPPLAKESIISPVEAQDTTLIIEGCGNQPVAGFTYCRLPEGSLFFRGLVFHLPPVDCAKTHCVHVKIFSAQGLPVAGLDLEKGRTQLEVPWKELLNRDVVQAGDRGLWIVLAEIEFQDPQGRTHKTLVEGEIRLRVLPMGYVPLHNNANDPDFYWKWDHGVRKFKMTPRGRSFVQ